VDEREKKRHWRAVRADIVAHWRTDLAAVVFGTGFVYSLFITESVPFAVITAVGTGACSMWPRAGAIWGRLPFGGALGAKKKGEKLAVPDAPEELPTQPPPDDPDAESRSTQPPSG
jgi:hypothetical protein